MLEKAQRQVDFFEGSRVYDEDFFEDALGLFPDASGYAPRAGRCGKDVYDGNNWNDLIGHAANYYVPGADLTLIQNALASFDEWNIPVGTSYIDLGVGGRASFCRYALPVLRRLQSAAYVGVDFCQATLDEIEALQDDLDVRTAIRTKKMDFFFPVNQVVSDGRPALGVMNGLTLGNIEGSTSDRNVDKTLSATLKHLSRLCGNGWLLLTIDTNQNETSLKRAYVNPVNSRLCLGILARMAKELPVDNFDPSLFSYDVQYFPDVQLLAHLAVATEDQTFLIGSSERRVRRGQKLHLFNSYKFGRNFFESCCSTACLAVEKSWTHRTGMMLYLLKDKECQPRRDVKTLAA